MTRLVYLLIAAGIFLAVAAHADVGRCSAEGKCNTLGPFEACRQRSPERSEKAKADFRKLVPCPSTGLYDGACPGWELDHMMPLCCGGADAWWNLRWLEHDLHKLRHTRGTNCFGYHR